MTTAEARVLVLTRGYLHDLPADTPPADIELDLRRLLADPAHRPSGDLLKLTGLHDAVRAFVFATPGATMLASATAQLVLGMATVKPHVVVIAGCAGGKHRAPAVGEKLGAALRMFGLEVEVRHLHAHLDRVIHERASHPECEVRRLELRPPVRPRRRPAR